MTSDHSRKLGLWICARQRKNEYFELQPEFFRRYDNTVRYNIDTDNNYDYDDDTMNDNDNDNNNNDTIPVLENPVKMTPEGNPVSKIKDFTLAPLDRTIRNF